MNLEYTDEQRALRDAVHRFLASPPPDTWRALAELGATGVLVPVEHGGSGLTMVEAAVVAEEAGAALLAEPWLSSAVAVPRALARFDGEADDLLTAIARGDALAAIDLSHNDVRVATSAEGDTLSGTLDGVADAGTADVLFTTITFGESVALYRVARAHPSVKITPLAGIDETRAEFRVELTDTPATLLGTADPTALSALIDDVFVAAAADALGAAQHLLDTVVEYAKTRSQFGQPIGSFQAVAHLCADMYEIVELARSGVMHAAWSADHADPVDRHVAALGLKGYAGRLASIGDTAIQVLGGIGFTWEHDAHRYLKRLLSWSSLLGGSDRYLEEVGRLYVGSVVG